MAATDRTTKQLLLRVPPELHAQLAARARYERRSMNAVANDALLQAVAPEPPPHDDQSPVDERAELARVWHRAAERGWLSDEQLAVPPEQRRSRAEVLRELRESRKPLPPGTADAVVADLIASRKAGL